MTFCHGSVYSSFKKAWYSTLSNEHYRMTMGTRSLMVFSYSCNLINYEFIYIILLEIIRESDLNMQP